MEEETYLYTCVECGYEWESLNEYETLCPKCETGNFIIENLQDNEK